MDYDEDDALLDAYNPQDDSASDLTAGSADTDSMAPENTVATEGDVAS